VHAEGLSWGAASPRRVGRLRRPASVGRLRCPARSNTSEVAHSHSIQVVRLSHVHPLATLPRALCRSPSSASLFRWLAAPSCRSRPHVLAGSPSCRSHLHALAGSLSHPAAHFPRALLCSLALQASGLRQPDASVHKVERLDPGSNTSQRDSKWANFCNTMTLRDSSDQQASWLFQVGPLGAWGW
jgi:hypothetical protein